MTAPHQDADRHAEVKALLFQCLDYSPDERERLLQASGQPDSVISEVRELLRLYSEGDEWLEGRPSLATALSQDGQGVHEHFELPKEVAGYRVRRLLGWGGMGIVYLAEQNHPKRLVALKVLRRDCPDDKALERLRREADALGRLNHSGIATIYEAGVAGLSGGQQPFVAMEFVEGQSILLYCKEKDLTLEQRLSLIAQVGDALEHAHSKGVIHRDLKPENIMVKPNGQPIVLDFGIAKLSEEEARFTQTGQLLGTIAYMSPEQARGGEADDRSDQFSLGTVAYELLSGRLPYDEYENTVGALVRRIGNEDPLPLSERVPNLPEDVCTIIDKALDPQPERRYASVRQFAEDVQRFLRCKPIAARPPTRVYQLQKLVRRNRGLAAAVFLALGGLTVGLVISLYSLDETLAAKREVVEGGNSVLRLSHSHHLEQLRARADELWPIASETVGPIDSWLADAEDLKEHVASHEAYLQELREKKAMGLLESDQSIGASVPGGMSWVLRMQESLVRDLEIFFGPDGLHEEIKVRRGVCDSVLDHTILSAENAWEAAVRSIADRSACPQYDGLRISAQPGLIPLGRDSESGLWEFALYGPSGLAPARVPVRIAEETGLVLVLIPGGEFRMGAQRRDREGSNYDPNTSSHEGPPSVVMLDPFFVSKFETTQAQWVRLMKSNPSYWADGEGYNGYVYDGTHPVEYITRGQALEFCERLGLALPTEAQWERAARGGTTSPYWWGDDSVSVAGMANLASKEDGYLHHAPVGSFPPNPYGLHDVSGNVWEWCLDVYKVTYFDLPRRSGDGLVQAEWDGDCSQRGGGFQSPPHYLRVARRSDGQASQVGTHLGFRAVRSLSGKWSYGP